MYDEHVLKYAAIDACAVYWLNNYINAECNVIDEGIIEKHKSKLL
jgi:hypothetical protein